MARPAARRRRARRRSSCSPTAARARRWWISAATRSSPGSTSRACTPRSRATSTPSPRSRSRPIRASAPRSSCAACAISIWSWWTRGRSGLFEEPGRRVGRALAWLRSDLTGDNGYARPIGGLLAIVDLDRMQVVRIDDHGVAAGARGARRLPRRRRAPLSRRSRADRGRAARGHEPRAGRARALAGARGACASASTRASR